MNKNLLYLASGEGVVLPLRVREGLGKMESGGGETQRGKSLVHLVELLNDAVYLRISIYKGAKMNLCSVCRADRAQSNGPAMRSLANFYIELEQFCCSLTAA